MYECFGNTSGFILITELNDDILMSAICPMSDREGISRRLLWRVSETDFQAQNILEMNTIAMAFRMCGGINAIITGYLNSIFDGIDRRERFGRNPHGSSSVVMTTERLLSLGPLEGQELAAAC